MRDVTTGGEGRADCACDAKATTAAEQVGGSHEQFSDWPWRRRTRRIIEAVMLSSIYLVCVRLSNYYCNSQTIPELEQGPIAFNSFWAPNAVYSAIWILSDRTNACIRVPFMSITLMINCWFEDEVFFNSRLLCFLLAFCNILECAILCRTFPLISPRSSILVSVRSACAFVGCTLGSSIVSGSLASATVVWFSPETNFWFKLYRWTTADCLGYFIFLPLFLSLPGAIRDWKSIWSRKMRLTLAVICLLCISITELFLNRTLSIDFVRLLMFTQHNVPIIAHTICFPLVLLCGNLLGQVGFASASLSMGLATIVNIMTDNDNPTTMLQQRLFRLQIFLMSILFSSLAMNVVQQKKVRALELSEDANRQKAAFISFLCHEIRNPLHAITNLTTFLIDSPLSPEQSQLCDSILISTTYLMDLMTDVLDTSKFNCGLVVLEPRSVHVPSMIAAMLPPLRYVMQSRSIRFVCTIDPFENILIDSLRLKQIINNLMSNAIKFTSAYGEINLRVGWSALSARTTMMTITMRDTGIGMSPTTIASLFQPYVQGAASVSRLYGGTGLGLSLCHQITTLMGGTITATSELHNSSTFTVAIPVQIASTVLENHDIILQLNGDITPSCAALATEPSPDLSGCPTTPSLMINTSRSGPLLPPPAVMSVVDNSDADGGVNANPESVLIVDDLSINRKILNRMLLNYGYTDIDECSNGSEAVERVRRMGANHYSFIFMDLNMPMMSGDEACCALRSMGTTCPIVVVSGNYVDEKLALAAFTDALPKPFHKADLIRILKQHAPHVDSRIGR